MLACRKLGLFGGFYGIYMLHNKLMSTNSLIGKKGDCTISMKDSDFMNMVMGKLGPQKVGADNPEVLYFPNESNIKCKTLGTVFSLLLFIG